MKTINDYFDEQRHYPEHVKDFVIRYWCEDPETYGDEAIQARMAIGRKAYEVLQAQEFHLFFEAVVITDPLQYRGDMMHPKPYIIV